MAEGNKEQKALMNKIAEENEGMLVAATRAQKSFVVCLALALMYLWDANTPVSGFLSGVWVWIYNMPDSTGLNWWAPTTIEACSAVIRFGLGLLMVGTGCFGIFTLRQLKTGGD